MSACSNWLADTAISYAVEMLESLKSELKRTGLTLRVLAQKIIDADRSLLPPDLAKAMLSGCALHEVKDHVETLISFIQDLPDAPRDFEHGWHTFKNTHRIEVTDEIRDILTQASNDRRISFALAAPRGATIIYCRISSLKQAADGDGLNSQEHRCRQYAAQKGYEVEAVFPDSITGGGDYLKRPGMVALLSYLDAQVGKDYVVIFDDLKRLARDTAAHIALRQELSSRGARVESLNFKFEETPEGKFIETIIAAQGQLEREQNSRQVVQKMKARVEKGFWVFRAPIGMKYVPSKSGGKILVRDEPVASICQEALEGFASNRFASQTEMRRWREAQPEFPKDKPNGEIRPQSIVRFLGKEVYAGLVSAPAWGVSLREGQHEGLISLATYERIQKKLKEGVYAPIRIDTSEDFVLRGAVVCSECGHGLTAGWCKGKYKRYPYYFSSTQAVRGEARRLPVTGSKARLPTSRVSFSPRRDWSRSPR